MKYIKIGFLFIFCIILFCGCPEKVGQRYITIVNNTPYKIGCQIYVSGAISYSDSIFQCRIAAYGIPGYSSYLFEGGRYGTWEGALKESIPFVQFLIIDAKSYTTYLSAPCDTIRKYVPILHCYQLTLEDLQRMNWTVVYPPEE